MSAREDGNAPVFAAGGGMAAIGLAFLAVIIAIVLGAWLSLYPIQSVLTIGAWFVSSQVAREAADGLTDFNYSFVRYAIPGVLALVTAIYTARLDQRLGERRGYWVVRHCVRLVVIALLVLQLHAAIQYEVICYSLTCFQDAARLSKGIPILLALTAVIVAHFALTSRIRAWWHAYLSNLHLRPSDPELLGGARLVSAVVLPALVAVGIYAFPLDRALFAADAAAAARRPARDLLVSRANEDEAAVLTRVLRDVLGVDVARPLYSEIRPLLNAQGVRVTSDRLFSRQDSLRTVTSTGDTGYTAKGVTEVRYTFGKNVLTAVSIVRPSEPGGFDRRLEQLARLYKVAKREPDWALMRGANVQLTLYVTEGQLVEFYEFVGHFERVR